MVLEIIASVRAEQAERKRRDNEYAANQRTLLAQVAGCKPDEVGKLFRD